LTMENLKIQLSMIPDAIKGSSLGIRKVTNMRTIASVMNECSVYKIILREVDKLLDCT